MTLAARTARREFLSGVGDTVPLIIGAIPFGIIFGALAVTSGLSPVAAIGMSLFVFAGSSQFIGVNLFAAGAAFPVIILTTFVVNLRHALYAATLAPHVRHLPQRWLVPLGYWLTDETFVIVAKRYDEDDDATHKHWYYLGSALSMYLNWQVCTLIGIVAGGSIENPGRWGLDFAMIVTFTGMIIPAIKTRPALVSVVVAAATAVIANPLPNKLGLIVAALCGVAAGVIAENAQPKPEVQPHE